MFRRELRVSERDPQIMVDSRLGNTGYVDSFGFEWTTIDGFVDKEVMSHGHVFGRFMLPPDFFAGKRVVDVGCGNGRIGRLIAPLSKAYCGLDLSEAIYAFPKYTRRPDDFALIRASGTDLPLSDAVADVAICWGVLHHMNDPAMGLSELFRVTKPGGTILIFIYPANFDARKNLNVYMRGLPAERSHPIISQMSDDLDSWREVDAYYAELLANYLSLSFKHSREWQKFQWFDGISPRYHWSLEKMLTEELPKMSRRVDVYRPGCFAIQK